MGNTNSNHPQQDPTAYYRSPKEVADLFIESISKLSIRRRKSKALLRKNEHFIRSILMSNDVDIFKVQWVDPAQVRGFLMEFIDDKGCVFAAEEIMKILQKELPSVTTEWAKMAQCIDHEMTSRISSRFASTAQEIELEFDYEHNQKQQEFIATINSIKKLSLTAAESGYLMALIQRATTTAEWQIAHFEAGSVCLFAV